MWRTIAGTLHTIIRMRGGTASTPETWHLAVGQLHPMVTNHTMRKHRRAGLVEYIARGSLSELIHISPAPVDGA